MSTDALAARPAALTDTPAGTARRSHWIDRWDPEDTDFWESTGRHIARRNLVLSIFAEHIGFSVWVIWTVVVINLANAGIQLSLDEQFLLTAVPNLIGSLLRIPYTFAVPRFGGRAWTTVSASLLLAPCLLLTLLVPSGWLAHQSHDTQLWVLILCAATAGVGGGNFSSSMANISFFYPERRKGFALGLNAAGGNLGVAVCQLLVPLVIIAGVSTKAIHKPVHPVHLWLAGGLFIPFVIIAALAAWTRMDSLTQARSDGSAYTAALRRAQTWVISLLYIGTFGSFIGFSFALPLVIKNTFPEFLAHHSFIATYLAGLAFVGALIGSLSRPVGGWLADRLGGARVTLGCLLAMAVATGTAIAGVDRHSFALFFASYAFVFLFSGIGNGSTYRMIPAVFAELGRRHGEATLDAKRRAAAAIGIAGAVGAFGGFLIQLALRQASVPVTKAMVHAAKTITDPHRLAAAKAQIAAAHATWSIPALWVFVGAYVVLAGITWFCYLRQSLLAGRMPSLAGAAV